MLSNARNFTYAGDVQHKYVLLSLKLLNPRYKDKFFLAESLTESAVLSFLNVLEALGLSPELR